MDNGKIKVLFIAGSGRSGSTILHNILGQIEGFSANGEIRYVWERGVVKNNFCGCEVPFGECEFWQNVMGAAFGDLDHVDVQDLIRLTESFRIKDLPLTLIPYFRQRQIYRLGEFLGYLGKLYHAIQSTTKSNVIIDATKNPSYGYLLQFVPKIDLYVLHLTRDSLGVAYSWTKKKEFQPGHNIPRKTPAKGAMQWNARNLSAEVFLRRSTERYMKLRYEDFVQSPQASVESILKFLGEQDVKIPFVTADTVKLSKVIHSVHGNPVRFRRGLVKLKMDKEWRKKMNKRHKLTVSALTWPLRLKYGYL